MVGHGAGEDVPALGGVSHPVEEEHGGEVGVSVVEVVEAEAVVVEVMVGWLAFSLYMINARRFVGGHLWLSW